MHNSTKFGHNTCIFWWFLSIPVLFRVFLTVFQLKYWYLWNDAKNIQDGCLQKAWLRRPHPKSRSNEMCNFTDFVTFSNAQNDTCFVNQTFCISETLKTLEKQTDIQICGLFEWEITCLWEVLVPNEQFLRKKSG